jgi:4-diphosphocytidyl-2-C-methyl-D-erythritol kinase
VRCERRPAAAVEQNSALGDLPEGTDNIVLRAVQLLRERAGISAGACVRLVKRIPSAAGLGGASSDAAAALLAANMVWRLGWSAERLADVATELGSDVPFFLSSTAAVCRGRGERVEPVSGLAKLHLAVVRPPGGLSTPEVYRHCRPADRAVPIERLLAALRNGDVTRGGAMLVNRLQQPAELLSPYVGRLRREFARTDCVAHQMSGSGTSYFGICRHARHARRVAAQLIARNVGRVYCAESIVAEHRRR